MEYQKYLLPVSKRIEDHAHDITFFSGLGINWTHLVIVYQIDLMKFVDYFIYHLHRVICFEK